MAIGFLGTGTLLSFIPLSASPEYIAGWYDGYDDGIAVMANAMTTIDDREAASGFALTKEQYRAVLRAAVGHNSNARSNRKVRQLLEME